MRRIWYYDENKRVVAKGEHAYFYKGLNGRKSSYKNLYTPYDTTSKELLSGKLTVQQVIALDKKGSILWMPVNSLDNFKFNLIKKPEF